MKLRTTRALHLILRLAMVGSLVIFFLNKNKDQLPILELVLLLVFILAAYLDYNLWRCPHCGSHLGKMIPFPPACPHCGKKILPRDKIHVQESRQIQKETKEKEDNED